MNAFGFVDVDVNAHGVGALGIFAHVLELVGDTRLGGVACGLLREVDQALASFAFRQRFEVLDQALEFRRKHGLLRLEDAVEQFGVDAREGRDFLEL